MKLPMGLNILVGFLIGGVAVLAGGQIWIISKTPIAGIGTGIVVGIFLVWFVWGWARPKVRRRFLGELHEAFSEEDFRHAVGSEHIVRERVGHKVKTQPRDIADSVRALLVKEKRADRK